MKGSYHYFPHHKINYKSETHEQIAVHIFNPCPAEYINAATPICDYQPIKLLDIIYSFKFAD